MKITQKQLKQIIREELSEQSFMDRLKGMFGGKKEEPEDPESPENRAARKAAKDAERAAADAASREEMKNILKDLDGFMKDMGLKNYAKAVYRAMRAQLQLAPATGNEYFILDGSQELGINPKGSYRGSGGVEVAIEKYVKRQLRPGGFYYEAEGVLGGNLKKSLDLFLNKMKYFAQQGDAYLGTTSVLDAEERERRIKAERDAAAREEREKYGMKTRDAFSESKITKEDVKQIIREEIKNFKR